ncbi:MAG TPA: YadA-like family protein, partial [Pseudoxanthomonas sp.]|nr:YadA-like family protein [Pseudoxanthomonas sp.]
APTDATAAADVPAAAASYADAGDANTLSSAQSYTDQSSASTLASAKAYADFQVKALEDDFNAFRGDVDRRFSEQDRRLDRMGAMSSAMLNMAINAAGSRSPRGRVAVGAGWQNGENALSVGYSKPIGERASFSIGGAFSGDEKSAGVGFGIDL